MEFVRGRCHVFFLCHFLQLSDGISREHWRSSWVFRQGKQLSKHITRTSCKQHAQTGQNRRSLKTTTKFITRALKFQSPSEGCPKIGDAHPVVLVISGYAPWKQISNLLTLASTQHGNTLRIKNTGNTSWKPLRSSSGPARDDDDDDEQWLSCLQCPCWL